MKPVIKNTFLISCLFIAGIAACTKEKITRYDGPDLVEFAVAAKTVTTTATPKEDSVLVQLVGKQRAAVISVTFQTDAGSTAVTPADYEVLTAAPAIPANASSAWIKFKFNKVTTQKTLKLVLTGGDNLKASENFKTYTFTLK
jgi:hypothetical protein